MGEPEARRFINFDDDEENGQLQQAVTEAQMNPYDEVDAYNTAENSVGPDAPTYVKIEDNNDFFSKSGEGAYEWKDEEEPEEKLVKRVYGGKQAVPKRIQADADSEDEMIIDMHERGVADVDIARVLHDEGRTSYNPKTIHSRYTRIRAARAQRRDMLLEEDLTDWHAGEDEVLLAAVEKADATIESEVRKLKGRRWEYAARNLQQSVPAATYSAKACRRRFQELQTGTAKIPPELDDDPQGRADRKADLLVAYHQQQISDKAAKFEIEERARKQQDQMDRERASKAHKHQSIKHEAVQKKVQRARDVLARSEASAAQAHVKKAKADDQLKRFERTAAKGDAAAEAIRAEHGSSRVKGVAQAGSLKSRLKAANKAPAVQRDAEDAGEGPDSEDSAANLSGLLKTRADKAKARKASKRAQAKETTGDGDGD